MQINYNPMGKWSAEAVKVRYSELSYTLGGGDGFEPYCKTFTNRGGFTWIYNIMESVPDRDRLGDKPAYSFFQDLAEKCMHSQDKI